METNERISTPKLESLMEYLEYQYPATKGDIKLKHLCAEISCLAGERDTYKEVYESAVKDLSDLRVFLSGGTPETYSLHIKILADTLLKQARDLLFTKRLIATQALWNWQTGDLVHVVSSNRTYVQACVDRYNDNLGASNRLRATVVPANDAARVIWMLENES